MAKKKKKKNQINKIINENGEVTADNIEIQRIIIDYYEELYSYEYMRQHADKMDNLEDMDKFLEKHNYLGLN